MVSNFDLPTSKILYLTSKYAEIVIYMVSPDGVTLLSNKELCKEESHAASNLNMVRSSMFACEAGVLPAPDAGTPLPTEIRNDILKGL